MSLADSIFEANSEPAKSLIDSLVEMAVDNSIRDRKDEFSIYQLHKRDDKVYYGHKEVKQTNENVYVLTEYEKPIPRPQLLLFWKKLLRRLPELCPNIIQISENLYWDKERGEIINKEEIYESHIPTQKP